jgi:hypothetical protein
MLKIKEKRCNAVLGDLAVQSIDKTLMFVAQGSELFIYALPIVDVTFGSREVDCPLTPVCCISIGDMCIQSQTRNGLGKSATAETVSMSNIISMSCARDHEIAIATSSNQIFHVDFRLQVSEEDSRFTWIVMETADLSAYTADDDSIVQIVAHPTIPNVAVVILSGGTAVVTAFLDAFLVLPLLNPSNEEIVGAKFLSDTLVACGGMDGTLYLFKVHDRSLSATGILLPQETITDNCRTAISDSALVEQETSSLLFVGYYDGSINVFELSTSQKVVRYPSRNGANVPVKFPLSLRQELPAECSSSEENLSNLRNTIRQQLTGGIYSVLPSDNVWLCIAYADGSSYVLGIHTSPTESGAQLYGEARHIVPDLKKFLNSHEIAAPFASADAVEAPGVYALPSDKRLRTRSFLWDWLVVFDRYRGVMLRMLEMKLKNAPTDVRVPKLKIAQVGGGSAEIPSARSAVTSDRSCASKMTESTSSDVTVQQLSEARANRDIQKRIDQLHQNARENREMGQNMQDVLLEFMANFREEMYQNRQLLKKAAHAAMAIQDDPELALMVEKLNKPIV